MNDRKIKICLKTVNNASLFVAKCGEYKDWDINYIHGNMVAYTDRMILRN